MASEGPYRYAKVRVIAEGCAEEVSQGESSHLGVDRVVNGGCSGPALPADLALILHQGWRPTAHGILGEERSPFLPHTLHSQVASVLKLLQLEAVVGIKGQELFFGEHYPPKGLPRRCQW